MRPKPKRAPSPKGIEATAGEIVTACDGLKAFIKVGFPIEFSSDLHERLQALRMAAEPLIDARDEMVKRFAKRKRGAIVYGDKPGEIVLDPNRLSKFHEESARWATQKRFVAVDPIRRSEIPHKVNGRDVILAGEVLDQLGPFLIG